MSGQPVYVVDDEEPIQRSLQLMLRVIGFAPQAFGSASEFLAALPALAPRAPRPRVRNFTEIPVSTPAVSRRQSCPSPAFTAGRSPSAPSVLLVEDDDAVRRSLQLLLHARGYDVRHTLPPQAWRAISARARLRLPHCRPADAADRCHPATGPAPRAGLAGQGDPDQRLPRSKSASEGQSGGLRAASAGQADQRSWSWSAPWRSCCPPDPNLRLRVIPNGRLPLKIRRYRYRFESTPCR